MCFELTERFGRAGPARLEYRMYGKKEKEMFHQPNRKNHLFHDIAMFETPI